MVDCSAGRSTAAIPPVLSVRSAATATAAVRGPRGRWPEVLRPMVRAGVDDRAGCAGLAAFGLVDLSEERDDLIDSSLVDARGRTNLERMQ